jgi:hypothetical protein
LPDHIFLFLLSSLHTFSWVFSIDFFLPSH